jgi:hypothetical protein
MLLVLFIGRPAQRGSPPGAGALTGHRPASAGGTRTRLHAVGVVAAYNCLQLHAVGVFVWVGLTSDIAAAVDPDSLQHTSSGLGPGC